MATKVEQIRALNDELRQYLLGGVAMITPGIATLGQTAVEPLASYTDDFCHENDPYEEHDFGAFDAEGARIFFKIDYYDKTLQNQQLSVVWFDDTVHQIPEHIETKKSAVG